VPDWFCESARRRVRGLQVVFILIAVRINTGGEARIFHGKRLALSGRGGAAFTPLQRSA
jgi:hypothetical protein